MVCSFPPPLTDDQLTTALDGEAETSVREHLAGCAACTARLAQARSVEQRLHVRLHRWDCPPAQQLGDYHLGLLAQADERIVVRHIEQCTKCTAELEELRVFLTEKGAQQPARGQVVQKGSRRRLGELVARLLPRAPALALRGSAAGPLLAEADGTTVVLDVQPVAGSIDVMGQVVADNQDEWTGALAELRSGGVLQAIAEVDDLGSFSFRRLTAGPAELRISPPSGGAIVVHNIDLDG